MVASVLIGDLAGATSPARADTPLVGADLVVRRPGTLPADPAFEYALLVVDGPVAVDGMTVAPGAFAYLSPGRTELGLAPAGDGAGRALLIGGVPFDEPVLMWWNFVARTKDEMVQARKDWEAASDRFGAVESELGRIGAPPPLWDRPGMQPIRN